MKNKPLFLLVLSLAFLKGYSQKQQGHYLELSVGPTFPIANYASKNSNDANSGFAGIGEGIHFSYLHPLKKGFGLTAGFYLQRNALNTKNLEEAFANRKFYSIYAGSLPPPAPGQWPYKTYGNWKAEKHAWFSAGLLAGVYQHLLPDDKNVQLTAKAMAGAIDVFAPAINGKSVSDTAVVSIKQDKSSAFGFAYSLAISAKYKMTSKVNVLAEVQYLGTNKITFRNVASSYLITEYSNGMASTVQGGTNITNRSQVIQLIQFSLGVAIPL